MSARLLLIEDDASIARFVELALQELPHHDPAAPAVELHVVGDLVSARTALTEGGWELVISDLMLPDGSAEALLVEGLALAPGAPAWVVFSAGMHEERRVALAERGVARLLRKPVPLVELLDVIADLLRAGREGGRRVAPPVPPAADDPVARHFGGDRGLYEAFKAGCLERFAGDLAEGEAALASGDRQGLRRVAHGLKAVLELLGDARLAATARGLEDAAAAGGPVAAGWTALAEGLRMLRGA